LECNQARDRAEGKKKAPLAQVLRHTGKKSEFKFAVRKKRGVLRARERKYFYYTERYQKMIEDQKRKKRNGEGKGGLLILQKPFHRSRGQQNEHC